MHNACSTTKLWKKHTKGINYKRALRKNGLITKVFTNIRLVENGYALRVTQQKSENRSILTTNHIGRLGSDAESERDVVHVEYHDTTVLRTAIRNTSQSYP